MDERTESRRDSRRRRTLIPQSRNNTAVFGSGIGNDGTMTLEGCTLSDNAATFVGGGIYNSGSLLLISSTLEWNSAENLFGDYTDGGGNIFM